MKLETVMSDTAQAIAVAREPGGVRVSQKLIAAALSLLMFVLGWAVSIIRSDAVTSERLAAQQDAIRQLQQSQSAYRPASELVSQDQFREFSQNVLQQLSEIKQDVKEVRRDLRSNR